MNAGPSKEQLERIYKTSRKYFDDLAKRYYENDREYYNKYFAPFYTNPIYASSKGIPNVKSRLLLMLFLILIAGFIFSLTYFLTEYSDEEELKAEKELIETNRNQELFDRRLLDSILKTDSNVRRLKESLILKEKIGGAKSIKTNPEIN